MGIAAGTTGACEKIHNNGLPRAVAVPTIRHRSSCDEKKLKAMGGSNVRRGTRPSCAMGIAGGWLGDGVIYPCRTAGGLPFGYYAGIYSGVDGARSARSVFPTDTTKPAFIRC
jgi:hypothetical protein